MYFILLYIFLSIFVLPCNCITDFVIVKKNLSKMGVLIKVSFYGKKPKEEVMFFMVLLICSFYYFQNLAFLFFSIKSDGNPSKN